ncbi:hypothetical protein RND81_07G092700 [Saponaria officinalis]|uniref:Uncharacterized protein n=1 Tax=Saponaria officinalis TaxID=3572 RepID=A0AAW1JTD0_SAPOF
MASLHFPQYEHELFYKYFNRLHEYVIRCPYPYQTWELCHVVYNGLNDETLMQVESLSKGNFINGLSYEEKWELFQYLAHYTEEWERYNSLPIQPQPPYSDGFNCHDNSSMSTEDMIRALATDTVIMKTYVAPLECNPSKSTEYMIRALMSNVDSSCASVALNCHDNSLISTENMIRAYVDDVNSSCANVTPSPCETNLDSQDLEDRVEQVTSHFDMCVTQEELDSYYIKWQAEQVDKCHDPLPLEPEVNHSYKEWDVNSEDDGFWDDDDEEDSYNLTHSSPLPSFSLSIDPSCAIGEITHVEDDALVLGVVSGDSTFEDLLDINVEGENEKVLIEVVSETKEKEVEILCDVRDDLLTLDIIVDTLPFGESLATLMGGEGISRNFQERKERVKDNYLHEVLPQKQKPPTAHLKKIHKVIFRVPYIFSFPYLILPFDSLSYKEPYRDLVANLEHCRGSNKCLLYAYTSFVHMLYQFLLSCYCYFTDSFASMFDKLLRALTCSALENQLADGDFDR